LCQEETKHVVQIKTDKKRIWWNYRFCDNEGLKNRTALWIWLCDLFKSMCCWSSHSGYSYYQWQTSMILLLDLNTKHHPFLFFFFSSQKSASRESANQGECVRLMWAWHDRGKHSRESTRRSQRGKAAGRKQYEVCARLR